MEIEKYYQQKAKQIIDGMFDAGAFDTKLTRDNMNDYEELLAFVIQSECKSHYKLVEFNNSIKRIKNRNKAKQQ